MRHKVQISLGADLVGNYAAAVTAFGGEPLAAYLPEPQTASCAALLLAGGEDVDPACYGEENTACVRTDAARDAAELRLIRAYVEAGKPVLGICRGQQLLQVYFGGKLCQHLPQTEAHIGEKVHHTHVQSGSFLEPLYGTELMVNSWHHQGVELPAPELEPVQWSEDGVIEAMQHRSLPVWCVQWHPERMCLHLARPDAADGSRLFRWFLSRLEG